MTYDGVKYAFKLAEKENGTTMELAKQKKKKLTQEEKLDQELAKMKHALMHDNFTYEFVRHECVVLYGAVNPDTGRPLGGTKALACFKNMQEANKYVEQYKATNKLPYYHDLWVDFRRTTIKMFRDGKVVEAFGTAYFVEQC